MNLIKFEDSFNEAYKYELMKKNAIKNIRELLDNYKENFLQESINKLPEDVRFSELKIIYRATYIILNKDNGAKPSFRLVFDLVEPIDDKELFTYEIEYNSNGEYSDDFFLDF